MNTLLTPPTQRPNQLISSHPNIKEIKKEKEKDKNQWKAQRTPAQNAHRSGNNGPTVISDPNVTPAN